MIPSPQAGSQDTGECLSPTIAPTPTFADLGVSSDLVQTLASAGIREPFPIQALTIPDALTGRDICGKARTGSGKTLAFGLAMVQRTERARNRQPASLVLVPTRELASQVATVLKPLAARRHLRLAAIYGGVAIGPQVRAFRDGVDIVIATPGRLIDLLDRGQASVKGVQHVVLDEADQLADMGFLPQVERILRQVEAPHQTLLFSATLDGDVDSLIRRHMQDPCFVEAAADSEAVDAMAHRFIGVEPADKIEVAAAIAAGPERTMFFVRTKRGADRLARDLVREGVRAESLHGGHPQGRRTRVLRSFASDAASVLVATNVAARGLDIDGVDIVVHYDLPDEHKSYVHRSGRTARAGASGVVVTLVLPGERRAIDLLRRESGQLEAVVPMRPDDERLGNLAAWSPPVDAPGRTAGGRPTTTRSDGPRQHRGRRPAAMATRRSESRSANARPRPALSTRGRPSGAGSPSREMFASTCASCRNEARVPFRPRGDRPVYCSDCFRAPIRAEGGPSGRR